MQYTSDYNLALPDGTDPVDVSVLNGNMSIIDGILADIYSKLPTPPPQPVVLDLPITVASSQISEFMGSDDVGLYEESGKTLNVTVGNSYTMTLTDNNDSSYDATATATEETDPDMGITYTNLHFVFFNIPQEIDRVLGSINVMNGAYFDTKTGEPSTDGYMWNIGINGGYTLTQFQSVVKSITLAETSP